MISTHTSDDAAHGLEGLELPNGWIVQEKIEKVLGHTGSFFSVCYKVAKGNEICFLKAFDFSKFRDIAESGKPAVDIMTDMLNAHRFERDLSERCRRKNLDKIVTVKEAGEVIVKNHSYPLVPYLIFDLADGDIRKRIDFSKELDIVWSLKSLHSIAVGLNQLHGINVSHQDLKPSNILVFNDESKIGDIGRSLCRDLKSPLDGAPFAGDWNYAPPETLYGVYEPDWTKRTFSADAYLLGSLIVFYFTGTNMTALIRSFLPDKFAWDFWRGTFDEVKDYLLDSYTQALEAFEISIDNPYLRRELADLVNLLCFPLASKRGHTKDLDTAHQFSLIRFITRLDILYQKARFNILR